MGSILSSSHPLQEKMVTFKMAVGNGPRPVKTFKPWLGLLWANASQAKPDLCHIQQGGQLGGGGSKGVFPCFSIRQSNVAVLFPSIHLYDLLLLQKGQQLGIFSVANHPDIES